MVNDHYRQVTVVSIGPADEHHVTLAEIVSGAEWKLCPDTRWTLKSFPNMRTAGAVLRSGDVSIVLYNKDGEPTEWAQTLDRLMQLPHKPLPIVTSRAADDRLWSEALNLGAYDVLGKPFDRAEVVRTLSHAWLRWAERRRPAVSAITRAIGMPLSAWC